MGSGEQASNAPHLGIPTLATVLYSWQGFCQQGTGIDSFLAESLKCGP